MTATPHILAGAAIGKMLRRPWLAWPVAFVSHFLLDFTPHLDSHAVYGVEQGGPADSPGWQVRVVPNAFLALRPNDQSTPYPFMSRFR